jgi:hypothetical protein
MSGAIAVWGTCCYSENFLLTSGRYLIWIPVNMVSFSERVFFWSFRKPRKMIVCVFVTYLWFMCRPYDILKPFSNKCASPASSYYSMALRSVRVPYLPELLPPDFSVPCCCLPVRIWSKSTASVQTSSFHLPLVSPQAFFPWITLSLLLPEYKNDPSLLHG